MYRAQKRPVKKTLKLQNMSKEDMPGKANSPLFEIIQRASTNCRYSFPQLNTPRITQYVHPHLYMYKYRWSP